LRAGAVVGAGADLAGAAGVGTLAASTMKWLSDQIHTEDTVESLHAQLILLSQGTESQGRG